MTTKLLTKEEWDEKTFPFTCLTVENNSSWTPKHYQFIVQWLEEHCGAGWIYFDGIDSFVFENAGDHIYFSVWIKSDPFDDKDFVDR